MNHYFSRLRTRIFLIVFLSILPFLGMFFYIHLEESREDALHAREDVLLVAQQFALTHGLLINDAKQLLVALAHCPAVRQPDAGASSAFLKRLLANNRNYNNLFVADLSGQTIKSALPLSGPVSAADNLCFQRAVKTKDFAIGNFKIGKMVGKPTLHLGYPVLDQAGDVQAVVMASLNLDWLLDLAAKVKLPTGSSVCIIDDHGTILARLREPEKWVGQTLPEAEIVKTVLAQREGVAEVRGVDGINKLYAFMPLGGDSQEGFVYVGIPTQAIFAPANQALARNLMGTGVVAILALVLAWTLAYLFIIRRLNVLVRTSRQVAAGDLSARTGLDYGAGEIDQLAHAFDHMAASLEQRETQHQQLEERLQNQIQFNETLLQTIPIPVFYKDRYGRYLGCNRAFEEIFGKTREEIIGKEVYEMGPPEIAGKYAAMDQELFERLSSQTYEWKVRSTDGSEREVIIHKASFLDAGGKIAGLIGVSLDITERKRAEEAVRESEERYRELFDNISSGVAIYEVRDNGNDFVFKDFNKAGERLDGDLRENLVGKSIFEVRSGIEGFGLLDVFRRVWKTGITEHFPAKIYQDERITKWYENFVYRLPSGEVVAVFDDVTQRKEAEKEIARLASFPQLNPNPVLEVDTGGNITFANPAALEIVQKLGLQGPEALLPPVLEQFLKASLKKGKGQFSLEVEIRGVIFAIYIYFTPQFQVARLFFIDITAGKRAEEERKLNEARLASLLRISQYQAASTQDLLDYALDEAIILTGSKIGYIYIYDEATEQFTLNTWSKEVMKECTVVDPPTVYQLEKTGIWGEAVRQARPIVVNDFQAPNPLKKGYPEGHVKLYKYLTIPVFSNNRIAVVVGVANKAADYNDADVRQLSLMMDAVWKIVERQQAEEKLQTAVNKWRTTFDAIGDAVCLLNQDFTILQCNQAMANLLEKPFTEILGHHCWELVHGASQPIQDCPLVRMRQTRQREELLLPRGDRWFKIVVDAILDKDGAITGAVQVISDITHLRKAEGALQRRSQELSLLNTVSSLMLRSMDLDTILRTVVEVVQQHMFQGKGMIIVFLRDKQTGGLKAAGHRGAPLDHPCLSRSLQVGECLCGRTAQQGEMVISRQGCQYRQLGSHQPDMTPHQDICLPMKVQDRILGVLHLGLPLDQQFDERDLKLLEAIADQISVAVEKVRLFEEVQLKGSQLRSLTARLAEIEEAERQHLARELHDQVGQSLTTLSLTLSMLKGQIPRGIPANVAALLMDAETLVSKTTDSVREVMSELRPPVLDDYGLMAALRWYGNEFSQRMRIAVEVQGEEAAAHLAPEVAMALFRITQEALNNVAKHAQASRVTLTGEVHNSSFRLVIADNGIGFDPKQVGQPEGRYCWGLMTMSERAMGAGGICRIESQPGEGTRVVVEVSR